MSDIPIVPDKNVSEGEAYIAVPGKDGEEPRWMKVKGLEVTLEEKDELSEMVLVNHDFDFEAPMTLLGYPEED